MYLAGGGPTVKQPQILMSPESVDPCQFHLDDYFFVFNMSCHIIILYSVGK